MGFYYDTFPWFVRAENEQQILQANRYTDSKRTGLHRRELDPAEVDFEMSFPKDPSKMELVHITQKGFEHFVSRYGQSYEYLYFNSATGIRDFTPLADLPNLRGVSIDWCRADQLWNMSANTTLTDLWIHKAKKITHDLSLIQTSPSLENILVSGDMDSPYPIRTLSCFSGLPNLRRIDLNCIKLEDYDTSFLRTVPRLEEFHFDAGMFTTEEIAYICAKYPHISGRCLGAYTTHLTVNDVRICGHRKPGLDLPRQQKRFDQYVAEFNALLERYKQTED